MPRPSITILLAVSFLVAPRLARAGDSPAAQALFDDAKRLMKAGRYDEACPKLQESQKLDGGMGTQFHLADCWQHIGRSASAWSLFREVESQAHALGQAARERVAHDRATALQPFLSNLVIVPRDDGQTVAMEVRRDGTVVERSQWRVSVPVDPGPHVVALAAANKRPWQTNVDVPPNGKTVTVELPALATLPDLVPPPPAVAAAPPPAPAAPAVPVAPPVPGRAAPQRGVTSEMPPSEEEATLENPGATQRALGWFFVGGGVVGLAASTYFGAKWIDDRNSQAPHCPRAQCDPTGIVYRDDARRQAATAEVTLAGGAASLVIGTILVVTAPSPRLVLKNFASIEVAPIAAPTQAGVAVRGAW
jgi:serine/threonine-protein kinase